jgi:hypothetical protein
LLLAKSLIKSSKFIWRNKSASIMSRDKDSSLSCLIVVLFWLFIRYIWENERSMLQFVTINVKNIHKLISTFGKTHSMLSSTITVFSMTESSFFSFCGTKLLSNIWVNLLNLLKIDKLLFTSFESSSISIWQHSEYLILFDNTLCTLY